MDEAQRGSRAGGVWNSPLSVILRHPDTVGLQLDDPLTTERRAGIIAGNSFLRQIYDEWYTLVAERVPAGPGGVLEIGSGGGFLPRYLPGVITSEILPCRGVQAILDARQLPFGSGTLKAIVMVDVLHHIPDVRPFFEDASRALRPDGVVVMVEPWVSTWSRFVFSTFHHEPFRPEADSWAFPSSGPLSGANGALPWMVFQRDRQSFEATWPGLQVRGVTPMMPFRYLVSGGVSMRQLMPGSLFGIWRAVDQLFSRWATRWPMFALIELRRS